MTRNPIEFGMCTESYAGQIQWSWETIIMGKVLAVLVPVSILFLEDTME